MTNLQNKNLLSRVIIRGFKSIAECDIELGSLNILVGANGAGKSNFIGFFEMMRQVALDKIATQGEGSTGNFSSYIGKHGGADNILYFGAKKTEEMYTELHFKDGYSYSVHFVPEIGDKFLVNYDKFVLKTEMFAGPSLNVDQVQANINLYLRGCQVYHFHDTGFNARIKKLNDIHDSKQLLYDGSNLAAFLLRLRTRFPKIYKQIVNTVRLVAPFFIDFHLEPHDDNPDRIILKWKHRYAENEDYVFYAANFSDGTLRFACLVTLFLQPVELQPEIILIDEPELGLHPYAINILAGLIKSAAIDKQVIISTQSTQFLNHFDPENLIVVDRDNNQSVLRRLSEKKLEKWLEDYALGELWEKNVFGGGPVK